MELSTQNLSLDFLLENGNTHAQLHFSEEIRGNVMHTGVIYSDGTFGRVTTLILEKLINSGEIVAYHCPTEWWEESEEDGTSGIREN